MTLVEFEDIEVCGKLFTIQVATDLNSRERKKFLTLQATEIRKHMRCSQDTRTFWEETNE